MDPYGLWFVDFNLTLSTGAGAAVTFGLQIGPSGIYGYGGGGVGAGEGASITLNSGDPCPGTSIQGTLSGGTGVVGGKATRSGSLDNNTDVIDLENNVDLGWGIGAGAALTVTETISILPF